MKGRVIDLMPGKAQGCQCVPHFQVLVMGDIPAKFFPCPAQFRVKCSEREIDRRDWKQLRFPDVYFIRFARASSNFVTPSRSFHA